jgi:hypothetical protein
MMVRHDPGEINQLKPHAETWVGSPPHHLRMRPMWNGVVFYFFGHLQDWVLQALSGQFSWDLMCWPLQTETLHWNKPCTENVKHHCKSILGNVTLPLIMWNSATIWTNLTQGGRVMHICLHVWIISLSFVQWFWFHKTSIQSPNPELKNSKLEQKYAKCRYFVTSWYEHLDGRWQKLYSSKVCWFCL